MNFNDFKSAMPSGFNPEDLKVINQVGQIDGEENPRIWCPVCENRNTRPGTFAPWFSPTGTLVCCYAICKKCTVKMVANGREKASSVCDDIEEALINRHPELLNKLPASYGVSHE